VLPYYNAELAALLMSLRARNVHRLDSIAANSKNDMAKVSALKALETIAEQAEAQVKPGARLPGGQIVIMHESSAPKVIDNAPMPAIE
jgi:hypothetical protein